MLKLLNSFVRISSPKGSFFLFYCKVGKKAQDIKSP